MSFATAVRDARHSRRVQSAQAQVVRRYRRAAGLPSPSWATLVLRGFTGAFLRRLGALLVPLSVWLGIHEDERLWSWLAAAMVFTASGHWFESEALEFAADDVLRNRSKAGLLLLRLWRQTPALLLTGACWAGAGGLLLGAAITMDPVSSVLLLLAVLLSPLAWTVGKLLSRLLVGRTYLFGSLTLPALIGASLLERFSDRSSGLGALGWVLIAALGVLAVIGGVRTWRIPRHLRLPLLGAELAMVPRLVFGCVVLWRNNPLPDPALLGPVAWCALALVLGTTLYALAGLVQAVSHAEEWTPGSALDDRDELRVKDGNLRVAAVLPEAHTSRRSLTRAAFYLHRRTHWFRPGELASPLRFVRRLPRILSAAFYHVWGPLLATLTVLTTSVWTTGSNVSTTMAIVAGAAAPAFVPISLSSNLHRLGVDYLEQARHNRRALVWFAVMPTLLAAGIAGTLAGWNAERRLVVAVLAAVFAVRAGWRGFLDGEVARHYGALIVLTLALVVLTGASLFVPLASWGAVSAAAGVGLAGVFLRLRRSDERALADAVRERDEAER